MRFPITVPSKLQDFFKSTKAFEKNLEKLKIITLQNGNCSAEMIISEEHTNRRGGLHGGLSATLVDSISSCALATHKYGAVRSVSVDLHVTFLKGAKLGDEIAIDARTLKAGKNLAFLEVLIKNKSTGELLVKGNHTKYFLPNT